MKRLNLLFLLSTLTITYSATAQDYSEIGKTLRTNNEIGIPTVKNFSDDFIKNLDKRGEPTIYTKSNSNNFEYIGMPIGGIGTGQLYIGGDGQLWFWDIFNHTSTIGDYKGEEAYEFPYLRSAKEPELGTNKVNQGFALKIGKNEYKLNRDGFNDISFVGQYPIAKVNYKDSNCPVEVDLEAYSPFIPLEIENSSFPATIFNYTVKNSSTTEVTLDLVGWLENCAMRKSKGVISGTKLTNEKFDIEKGKGIMFSGSNNFANTSDFYDYGDMCLTVLDKNANQNTNTFYTNIYRAPLNDGITYTQDYPSIVPIGTVSSNMTLKPGEERKITFILSWYFPNCGVIKGGDRLYGNDFKSSKDVAQKIISNFDYLTSTTEKWNKTWYDSSLPYWFLDRTFVNVSTLATQTSYLFEDGRFYAFEGGLQGTGTCTHVWGYAQALGRVFPALEQNLREKTDFAEYPKGGFNAESGKINFRGVHNNKDAVDGHSSIIVRSYVTHKMSKDDSFLKANYANIKKAMEYLINTNDSDHDGILSGPQHNTLDSDWTGKVAWLSGYYQTALRACAMMSKEYGDDKFAKYCMEIALKGKSYLENELFNGEYFIQLPETDGTKTVGIQNGCEYSQMLGQSQAYHIGLGEVVDSEKITSALNALWKYNFSTDVGPYREENSAGRWYAMSGEGGLIACTWPNGGKEALLNDNPRFAAYNNECQNGYEYAATSLMMWHDQPYRALAHVWFMDQQRYLGDRRNPYCEIEWGLHYGRSMASYGLFTAACGFDYHGPKGELKFSPKIQQNNFKAPFITAEGWGTYSQIKDNNETEYTLTVTHGSLTLNKLIIPSLSKKSKVSCMINDKETTIKSSFKDNNLIISTTELKLVDGDVIKIKY